MIFLTGKVIPGFGHFVPRVTKFSQAFKNANGQNLIPDTLNVKMEGEIPIREHFRIRGTEIGEPEQDLLFEVCRANGIWAYRIRPYNLRTRGGGHGDNTLEIACSQKIPYVRGLVEIALFRDN